MTDIMRQDRQSTEVIQAGSNPVAAMLQAFIERGGTVESAGALAKLYMDMENFNARRDFEKAFAELQEAIPNVLAKQKNTQINRDYDGLSDIQEVVNPVAKQLGFSIRFDSQSVEGGMRVECIVTHKNSGHSERSGFTVRTSQSRQNSSGKDITSPTQMDVGALTTGRRMSLRMMFNLKIDYDADVRLLGDYITEEQAESLKERLSKTGRDADKFLKLAQAPEFSKIRAGKYAMLDGLLLKAEKQIHANTSGGPSAKTGDVHAAHSPAASPANAEPIPSQTKGGGTGQPPKIPSLPLAGTAAPRNVPASREEREPPENAAQDWANQDVRFLTDWLMKLNAKDRASAMVLAQVGALLSATDEEIRSVAYNAFFAQATKGNK